jgi:ketosteroid isomerase-like protein
MKPILATQRQVHRILWLFKKTEQKNEAAIRELIDGFVKAIRAKDINGVMSVFAPEVVSFDLGPH